MSFFKYLSEPQPPGPAETKRLRWLYFTIVIAFLWIITIGIGFLNFFVDLGLLEGNDLADKIGFLVYAVILGPAISLLYIIPFLIRKIYKLFERMIFSRAYSAWLEK